MLRHLFESIFLLNISGIQKCTCHSSCYHNAVRSWSDL